jgi:hypothetical protein
VNQDHHLYPFTAAFPDTNVFLPRWPEESAGLAELISTTGILGIPVYLVEPVEIELEAHQLREAKDALEKIAKISGSLHPLVRPAIKLESLDWEKVRSQLRAQATATKVKLGLRTAAFPALALQDLFQMAASNEHPFTEGGKNFQDAVILRAVIEASRLESLHKVAFVTKNHKDFDKAAVLSRAKESGIVLHLYTSLDDLHEALWPHVKEVFQTAWNEDNRLAKTAIEGIWNELEQFLRAQLVKTQDVTLELLKLGGVQAAWWDRVTQKLSRTGLTFSADVKFVMTRQADESRNVQEYRSEIERGVTIEGWATFVNGAYTDVQFESAFISR